MSAKQHQPRWWRPEYEAAWEQARRDFEHDREADEEIIEADTADPDRQTGDRDYEDFGRGESAEYRMSVEQDAEEACKFGFGARKHYGAEFRAWGPELEARLQSDWFQEHAGCDYRKSWDRSRDSVRKGWEYANV